MEVKAIESKIKELRELSKSRNFKQTFDLVFNLQNMDLKRPDHKVDIGITLSSTIKDKKLKICAIIDHSITGAEDAFDKVVYSDELSAIKGNMDEIRKLTQKFRISRFLQLVY